MLELIKRFSGRFRLNLILGPACKLVEVCFDLCVPLVVARMIDEGVGGRDVHAVLMFGGVLIGMALVGIGFTLICQKMASTASQGMGTAMREAMFDRINEFSYAELDRFGTPSLITRLTGDVNQVQLAIALAVRQLIRWPLLAVGSVIAALAIDVQLGLIFLVSTPLVGVVFWVVMAKCVPYFKQMQRKLDRIALITREGLSGARVIRAFVREEHERERFREAAFDQAATAIAVGRLSSVLNPTTLLVMDLAVCAILWSGGLRVDAGGLTQGQVVACVNYMTQTLLSIVYVANLVVVFTKAAASASRINEVLHCAPSITDAGAEPVTIDGATCALRFDTVSFAFAGARADALTDATFQLGVGETLGVIGGTGSGKSTLVSLIARLYDASEGAVEVMGTDVRRWPLAQLRRVVSVVPQQATLLSGTIRSNLTWRRADATDEELWRALEVAQAAPFVRELPQGLDAPVEAGGKNFSGGQRQRLTIARALVGEPDILILDDASSALDFKTDAALRSELRSYSARRAAELGRPCTTVIVSQRVSAVRDADLICVLSHGVVVGRGTHDELLATCPMYREICQSQGEGDGGTGSLSPDDGETGSASPVTSSTVEGVAR